MTLNATPDNPQMFIFPIFVHAKSPAIISTVAAYYMSIPAEIADIVPFITNIWATVGKLV